MSVARPFPVRLVGRRVFAILVGLVVFGASSATAQAAIDNTCQTCNRKSLDSANLQIGRVRVNQVGYRTDDPAKRALVADPKAQSFQIIRENGTVAYTGALASLGTADRGRMQILGYYNSTTKLYEMTNDTANTTSEAVWSAPFGNFQENGRFRLAVGADTSQPFEIRKTIYNDILETSLKFFGIQRSGDNDSWFHGPSHMKDGSARGAGKAGSLQGGWYDCGDHFKVGQTIAYAFNSLILTYTLWPQKAEDRYGSSYNDTLPFGTDGIPDILREAKIGADWVVRLYKASEEDGLLAKNDMYLQVGVNGADHAYWDKPENQDAQPASEGGPDRVVHTAQGSAVPAAYAGSLALFARAWEPFDPVYADSCLKIAKDIYARIVIPNRAVSGYSTTEFYVVQGRFDDDLAWAAAGLWVATGDTSYKYDLMDNTSYGNNTGAVFNLETFHAGFLARHASKLFSPGGWVMDYQNNFIHTVWLLHDMVYRTDSLAARWQVPVADAQDMRMRLRTVVRERYISESTDGPVKFAGTNANVQVPYNLVWTSMAWGVNRYNMGGLLPVVAYHDMIHGDSANAAQPYWTLILNNMNYNLGANPWDMSFLMGAGSKNLQHPHHRGANSEGYDAGGIPYEYRSPKGAFMGGAAPGAVLVDYWRNWTYTETCIDFSAQNLLPAQYLAEDLPPDITGPVFSNVTVVQVTNTTALVSWITDELSRDTLFYSLTPGGPVIGKAIVNLGKNKSVEITGLTPDTRYWFFFKGMDIYRNVSRDDNRGRYYDFTTTKNVVPPATISDVRVCNIHSDHATVFWWTDIPSTSSVEYAVEGADFAATKVRVDGDDEGLPGRFHKVTLKGLKAGTTYRFDAISGSTRSDSAGLHHRFATIKDFANYTIQIKATNRNGAGNAHFYMEVANNESKPYVGLELRFYFQADAATAQSIVIRSNDLQRTDEGGMWHPLNATFGAAVAVPGIANQWYLPIKLLDTLVVAGRARIEMQMTNSNYQPIALSVFQNAWSLSPHTTPVASSGVDLSYLWAGPEAVESKNGVPTVTYVKTPYIAAFYDGVHVYGYPPDGTKPRVVRTTRYTFTGPLPSPATSVKQDSVGVHFGGRTWSFPDILNAQWQVDAPSVRTSAALAGRTDSVSFRHDTLDAQGATAHEFAFWGDRDSSYCSCAWQRYTVVVDTQKAIYRLGWTPDSNRVAKVGTRIPYVITLSDSAGVVAAAATVSLVSSNPLVSFYGAATGPTTVTSVSLVNGKATVWVSSDSAVSAVILTATGASSGAVVTPAVSAPVTFAFEHYHLTWKPDSAKYALVGKRIPLTVVLASDSLDTVSVSGPVGLVSNKPYVFFYASETATAPTAAFTLVNGTVTVWVSSDSAVDSALIVAAGVLPKAIVDPGTSAPVSFYARIPPRYRVVWNPDSVRSALVGSRLPYTLLLVSDTLSPEPVAGTVALVSDKPGVLFYGSATSTVPVTSVSVIAGQAVVWVSAATAVDSAVLRAAGTVLDAIVDSGRSRYVSFLQPPPWPVLDSARTRDTDCDGAIDHVELALSMSPGGSRFTGLVVLLGSDTAKGVLSWNTDSTLATLSLSTPVAGSGLNGGATLWWTAVATGGRDTLVAVRAAVRDRVGPRLVSASILENFKPATVPDTLRVEFSEPVRAPVSGWPFAAVSPVSPALANGKAISSTVWQWTIGPGAATTVSAGQILRGGIDASLLDTSGNAAAGCGTDTATVQLRTRPVPLKSGAVVDRDGDGRADAIHLVYERGLRATELPDSVRVSWGTVVASFPVSGWTRGVADSSRLEAVVLPQWAASAAGANPLATAIKGVGANLWTDSVVLADSVGPSLSAAVLRFGSDHDTLLLRGNETVAAGAGIELSRQQSILSQAISRETRADGTLRLVFPSGILQDGDSLRFTSAWTDASGNVAAPAAPWVAVLSGDRPPVDAWLRDSDGDGRADLVHLRWDRPFRRKHAYMFSWLADGAWVVRSADTGNFVATGLLDAEVSLPNPFPFGATGLEGASSAPARQIEAILDGWVDSLAFAVRDSVDPAILSAEVRYASTDGQLDTLVARFSETLLLLPVTPAVVLHVQGPQHVETVVVHGAIVQTTDGRTAFFQLNPMDSSHTVFARGDSVRIAPASDATVRDPLGNIAAGASPWTKIVFGARLSRFKVSMYPKALHLAPSGAAPDADQLRVLVRSRGSLGWTTLDGAPAGNTGERIGPMIASNGGFGGQVHIYDNMGVSVASVDLAFLEQAWSAGTLPSDPSGQYEVWVSWNGASRTGKMVGSGVYTARLILRRDIAADGQKPMWTWTNDLIRFGWKISID